MMFLNNIVADLLSEATDDDSPPVEKETNDEENDEENDKKDVEPEEEEEEGGKEPLRPSPSAPDDEPSEEEPREEAGTSGPSKKIRIGITDEEDSAAVRKYIFESMEEHLDSYRNLQRLMDTIRRKRGGSLGNDAAMVLDQISKKLDGNVEMVEDFFDRGLIVDADIAVIYRIHKIHQTDIRNVTTLIKQVSRQLFNK